MERDGAMDNLGRVKCIENWSIGLMLKVKLIKEYLFEFRKSFVIQIFELDYYYYLFAPPVRSGDPTHKHKTVWEYINFAYS